ncbi:MAG TPA: enoyl-CoA hydratase/isomerase family protein [Candidatus Acidoferrales bacterium]|nr:enoyl-CoA hydratase/isomerase family protein [Candidatus Acidoferrales bacterium]
MSRDPSKLDVCHVGITIKNRVGSLVLDRPPLNVMNIAVMNGLHEAIVSVSGKCDLLILRGAGERAFSAGTEVADHVPDRVGTMLSAFHSVFLELWRSNLTTIAAVHGHCLGGGCELATFCDFVVASESATFGVPEIKLGCFPPVAMVTFPRLVGMRSAFDLILSGRTISPVEAQRLGLVTRVVPDKELDHAVDSLAKELGALSPDVLGMARRQLWSADGFDFERSLQSVEDFYLRELMKTHDANEGIRAFLEKRLPLWQSGTDMRKEKV